MDHHYATQLVDALDSIADQLDPLSQAAGWTPDAWIENATWIADAAIESNGYAPDALTPLFACRALCRHEAYGRPSAAALEMVCSMAREIVRERAIAATKAKGAAA